MSDKKKSDVSTPNAAYNLMTAAAELCYNLMGGTRAMQAHCDKYLPQELAEEPTAYKIRVARSFLFNKYGKTVNDLVGRLFRNGIKTADIAPDLEPLLQDIDMCGRDLARFSRDLFEDALHPGVTYLLVDYPEAPPEEAAVLEEGEVAVPRVRSVADETAAGLRPYWVHIKQGSLINWKSETIDGVERLVRVQILEDADGASTDEWDDTKIQQVKVLRPGSWEIWQLDADKKEWLRTSEGLTSLDFIPLIPIYLRQTGFMTGKPVLENLAELNLCHFQSSSDQRNILHVARVPILFGAGFEDTKTITVGGNSFVTNGDPNSKLTYVEHTGKSIEAGLADIKLLEDQMKICAMEPIVPKTGAVTATAKAIDTAEAAALLQTMGETLGDCLELAMQYSMRILKKDPSKAGTIAFECDFSGTLGQQTDLDALQKARIGGANGPDISRVAYLKELQRRDVMGEDFDAAADEALLTSEGPSLGNLGTL